MVSDGKQPTQPRQPGRRSAALCGEFLVRSAAGGLLGWVLRRIARGRVALGGGARGRLPPLMPEFRVITWDERGFGQTQFDGKPFTYWDSARDCLALMDHLKLPRAVVGGMSQGGYLSLRVALTAPERVLALVLIDTQAALEDAEKRAGYQQLVDAWATLGPIDQIAQTIATIIIDAPGENERWIARWKARPRALIVEPGRCLLERDDVSLRLREITCPALVIHGTNDTAIPMHSAEAMAAALRGCTGVVRIDGAAHASNLTHPQPVNAALLPFLRWVAAAQR